MLEHFLSKQQRSVDSLQPQTYQRFKLRAKFRSNDHGLYSSTTGFRSQTLGNLKGILQFEQFKQTITAITIAFMFFSCGVPPLAGFSENVSFLCS